MNKETLAKFKQNMKRHAPKIIAATALVATAAIVVYCSRNRTEDSLKITFDLPTLPTAPSDFKLKEIDKETALEMFKSGMYKLLELDENSEYMFVRDYS